MKWLSRIQIFLIVISLAFSSTTVNGQIPIDNANTENSEQTIKATFSLPDGGHTILLEKNYKKFQAVILGFLNQP